MSDQPKENPPTRDILKNHELAWRTITQHDTDLAIFDGAELDRLERFVKDPSPENRKWVLESCGAVEPDGIPEEEIGKRAAETGSLAAYVIARYGRVADYHNTFYPSEVEELRKWFEKRGEDAAKL